MPTLNRDELRQVVLRASALDPDTREGLDAICDLYRHFHTGGAVVSCATDPARAKTSRLVGKLGIFRGQIRDAHRDPSIWKDTYHALVLEVCQQREPNAFLEETEDTMVLRVVTSGAGVFLHGSYAGTLRAFPNFAALQAAVDRKLPPK